MAVHSTDKISDGSELVTITKAEYEELVNASNFLNALEMAGVDNWDGYEIAREMM